MRDCVLAGALGDALGYPLEFLTEFEIDNRYASDGKLQFLDIIDEALYVSDDTQMSLYTLEAILKNPDNPIDTIYEHYQDWCWSQLQTRYSRTQICHPQVSSLLQYPEMLHDRAPGTTCLDALMSGRKGTFKTRINYSKGCGGVMRIAPIAIYYGLEAPDFDTHKIGMIGVEAASITHGHNMNVLASYNFIVLLTKILRNPETPLLENVKSSLQETQHHFAYFEESSEYECLIQNAIFLSQRNTLSDREAIQQLGEGWIAEETLAIAIYASLKYQNNFSEALLCSVNHRGDSDSTGIVTGNILGTLGNIPMEVTNYYKQLDGYSIVLEMTK